MSDEYTTISTVRGNSEFTPIEVKEGSDGFVLLQQGDMAIAIHPSQLLKLSHVLHIQSLMQSGV